MDSTRSLGFAQASIPDAYDRYMLRQLFEPWAAELVRRAALQPGSSVLDVASGLGPVARLSAAAVGARGRVVASDISAAMLAHAAVQHDDPASSVAPVEFLECSASASKADADSFDAVLCQQGLQFFPDRVAAAREMRRVARPDGVVLVSTWAAERPLGLFGPINETLREQGMAEPFPHAFDSGTYRVGVPELRDVLLTAGWRDVQVETVELDVVGPSAREAACAVLGTPFGPLISALPIADQEAIRARLMSKLGGSSAGVTVRTASNIAQAVK